MGNASTTRTISACAILAAAACLAVASGACAAGMGAIAEESAKVAAAPEARAATVASGFAQITGLAISPLIVLVAIGWIDFASHDPSSAASLPLHANPWFLVPCSVVLALALLKKCASPALPLPLRKLLDACEYLEAKLSALVAAGVLLPTIVSTMAAAMGTPEAGGVQTAAFLPGFGAYLLLVPAAIAVFASVWISFHVIDALIVLSPFAIVDTILVMLRGAVLATLGLSFLISPYLAVALCLPVIVASFLFAGWCVRLDLFAMCVATDLLFARSGEPSRPRAFLARRGLGAPIRTMGHAEPSATGVRFTYRPLFVLPLRTLEIPVERASLVHGLVWPTLVDAGRDRSVVAFPPRFRRCADRLALHFRAELRDGRLRGGLRRIRQMFADLLAMIRGESTQTA